MATKPTLEPPVPEEQDFDDGEESDVYEIEGEDEGDYQPEDDEDEEDGGEGDEGAGEVEPENMTALLLGQQNGKAEGYDEDEEDEDEEYQDEDEGTAENPIDLSSVVAGSKRGVDELGEGGADGDEAEVDEGENVTKKARV